MTPGIGQLLLGPGRLAGGAVVTGIDLERRARRTVARESRRALLNAVEAAAGSRIAGEVVERVLDSALVEQAANQALAGPLPALIVHDVVEYRIVERAAEELVGSAAADALVARVMDSGMLDEVLARLLDSKSFWAVIDEVARSPAVTAAISHQSQSFAGEVAGQVRGRSSRADDWLERRARLLARRRARNGSD